jgi:DNA-binding NarL/FixJ family response regulator
MKKKRVLLADDNDGVLDSIRGILELEFDVIGTVPDGEALITAAEKLKPDVMVVDVSMPVMSGIEAARRLKNLHPEGKIVFLSIHQEPAIVREALSTGAAGYVVKTSADEDLIEAIREALQGRSYISPSIES